MDGSSSKERLTVSAVEEEVYVPGVYHAVFDFTRVNPFFHFNMCTKGFMKLL